MIKMAALFDDEIAAQADTLPIYQVKEFWPTLTIGGSVFTPGFLAMLLSDSWTANQHVMQDWSRMALYYAAVRGMNRGKIRVLPGLSDGVVVRYRLTEADQKNISAGLARLGEILFAAGAKVVYPSLRSPAVLKSVDQCRGFLKQPIPIDAMALSTVHAFSSCPMGENPDFCATDSFGKVNGFRNLYVNDASLIPDSPGVNPQGATMAIALRNVDHFTAERSGRRRERVRIVRQPAPTPPILISGVPGWLGTRLVEVLIRGLPGIPRFAEPDATRPIRCLVQRTADDSMISPLSERHRAAPRRSRRPCVAARVLPRRGRRHVVPYCRGRPPDTRDKGVRAGERSGDGPAAACGRGCRRAAAGRGIVELTVRVQSTFRALL